MRVLGCTLTRAGPGGWRLWPKPGYWVRDETATTTRECSFPAQSRCSGWNSSTDSVACGVGYDPSSPLCEACLPGYYPDASGTVVTYRGVLVRTSELKSCGQRALTSSPPL